MKNIKVDEKLWKELMLIKYELGKPSVNDVIDELLKIRRKRKKWLR